MNNLFSLKDKVIVISGATGVLAGAAANYLASQGANVVFLGRSEDKLKEALAAIKDFGGNCAYFACNVLDADALAEAKDFVLEKYGRIDVLINGAGGNMPGAVVMPDKSVFDLDYEQWQAVLNLNLGGTLLPTLAFGKVFETQKKGVVINFSSMSATQALTRVLGYSNAKAAVDNLTKWLAVELAKKIGDGVRVNAVAPGFFISDQNRALLTSPDGGLTARGTDVIKKTPFGRFGNADDLFGTIHFLCSDASAFVTGTVIPVDGGFSCFSGV